MAFGRRHRRFLRRPNSSACYFRYALLIDSLIAALRCAEPTAAGRVRWDHSLSPAFTRFRIVLGINVGWAAITLATISPIVSFSPSTVYRHASPIVASRPVDGRVVYLGPAPLAVDQRRIALRVLGRLVDPLPNGGGHRPSSISRAFAPGLMISIWTARSSVSASTS